MAKVKKHPYTYSCLECGKDAEFRVSKKNIYCSISCQTSHKHKQFIESWLSGNITGAGVNGASSHIKRYLLEQQNHKCAKCGINSWNDQPIVLELEHKDGNSSNNSRNNLECLCPNCHSQTLTYKNRNTGNGRHLRRLRYSKGKSF